MKFNFHKRNATEFTKKPLTGCKIMIIIERYYSEKCLFMGFGKHIGGKRK